MKRSGLRRVRSMLIPAVMASCLLLQWEAAAAAVAAFEGTPEEIGNAYGKKFGETIKRVIKDMITDDFGSDPDAYRNVLAGSRTNHIG
jgi:hypothetical protein